MGRRLRKPRSRVGEQRQWVGEPQPAVERLERVIPRCDSPDGDVMDGFPLFTIPPVEPYHSDEPAAHLCPLVSLFVTDRPLRLSLANERARTFVPRCLTRRRQRHNQSGIERRKRLPLTQVRLPVRALWPLQHLLPPPGRRSLEQLPERALGTVTREAASFSANNLPPLLA